MPPRLERKRQRSLAARVADVTSPPLGQAGRSCVLSVPAVKARSKFASLGDRTASPARDGNRPQTVQSSQRLGGKANEKNRPADRESGPLTRDVVLHRLARGNETDIGAQNG